MIKAEELRIGNIVLEGKIERMVESIDSQGINIERYPEGTIRTDLDDIYGIPLTEEWLLRMGGTPEENGIVINNVNCSVCVSGNDFYFWDGIDWSSSYSHIKYVHQLQNLFYALTGSELNIEAR